MARRKEEVDISKFPPFLQFIILGILAWVAYELFIKDNPALAFKIKLGFWITIIIIILSLFIYLYFKFKRKEPIKTEKLQAFFKWLFTSPKTKKYIKPPRKHISRNKQIAIFRAYGSRCAMCGRQEHLEIHHIDGDRSNNKPKNLIPLCGNCHKKNYRKEQLWGKWKRPKY